MSGTRQKNGQVTLSSSKKMFCNLKNFKSLEENFCDGACLA